MKQHFTLQTAVLLAFVFFIFSGCKSTKVDLNELQGVWVLRSIDGVSAHDVFKGALPTISIDSESTEIEGSSGCNYYHGNFELEKNHLLIEDVISTSRLCAEENQEKQFMEALRHSGDISIEAGVLMFKSNKNVILEFVSEY